MYCEISYRLEGGFWDLWLKQPYDEEIMAFRQSVEDVSNVYDILFWSHYGAMLIDDKLASIGTGMG